jgi:hypothetical protein
MFNPKEERDWLNKGVDYICRMAKTFRIIYYLDPYLNRCEREGRDAHFDDIVQSIMPLLKNDSTPEKQTILSVLQDIGEHYGKDCWRLKPDTLQQDLFQ